MCCVKLKLFLFYGLIKKIFLSKCISIFQSSEKSIVSIVLPSPLFAEILSPGSRGFFFVKIELAFVSLPPLWIRDKAYLASNRDDRQSIP